MSSARPLPRALLDANVLYSQFVRDVLLHLAAERLFTPLWTDRIQREWTEALLTSRPELRDRLRRTVEMMARTFPYAHVAAYAAHEEALAEVDAKDRHVAAAAVRAGASHLVTFNLRDFPPRALEPFGVRPVHPDEFVCTILTPDPDYVRAVLDQHRTGLQRPPYTPAEYRAAFIRAGLVESAKYLPEE